jgi:hypothetical protein
MSAGSWQVCSSMATATAYSAQKLPGGIPRLPVFLAPRPHPHSLVTGFMRTRKFGWRREELEVGWINAGAWVNEGFLTSSWVRRNRVDFKSNLLYCKVEKASNLLLWAQPLIYAVKVTILPHDARGTHHWCVLARLTRAGPRLWLSFSGSLVWKKFNHALISCGASSYPQGYLWEIDRWREQTRQTKTSRYFTALPFLQRLQKRCFGPLCNLSMNLVE